MCVCVHACMSRWSLCLFIYFLCEGESCSSAAFSLFQRVMSCCPCCSIIALVFLSYVSSLSSAQHVPQHFSGTLHPMSCDISAPSYNKTYLHSHALGTVSYFLCLCLCVCVLMLMAACSVLFTGCCSVITCSRSVDLCFMRMCAQGTDR